jgi:small subunit ribosomal protein S20
VPNIKSAIKRVEVNQKRNEINKSTKSKISTYIKKFKTSVKDKNFEAATQLLNQTFALLDSAAKDNIIHKNSANSKKASLSKMLDTAKS